MGLTRAVVLDRTIMGDTGGNVEDSIKESIGESLWGNVKESTGKSLWGNVKESTGKSLWERVWKSRVGSSLWGSFENSLWRSVRESVEENVAKDVWSRIWNNIGESVEESFWDNNIWDGVYNSVGDSVRDGIGKSVRKSLGNSFYVAHDASWLAFYRYFHDIVGLVDQTSKLSGLWELAQSACGALPHRPICWVSERHNILCRDDRGQLHSLTGPACAFPDGWSIYVVHGVRVPAFVIEEPSKISVTVIDAERNAEIRRVMIDRYRIGEEVNGAIAYLQDAGAERLDHDEQYGTLWRRNIAADEPIVMIEVINATPETDGTLKHDWLRVPPDVTTAREAVAWTFDVSAEDYIPTVET